MACGISKGIGVICDALPASGTKPKLVLINYDDFLGSTIVYDTTQSNVIRSITLPTGKKGYVFEGLGNSNVVRSSVSQGTFKPNYTHEVDFTAFEVGPNAIKTLQDLNLGRVVAIYHDNNKAIRLLGTNAGLRATNNAADTSTAEIGGAHQVTLSSSEEKGYPEFWQVLDGATTPKYDEKLTVAALLALTV
jgi:hypothetical protein